MRRKKITKTSQIIHKDDGKIVIHMLPTDVCSVRKALQETFSDEVYTAAMVMYEERGKIILKELADTYGCTPQNIANTLARRGLKTERKVVMA